MAARGVDRSRSSSKNTAKAATSGDAQQVARRARKAGNRAASTVAKAVSRTAKKVAEAVSSTAQKVAQAARGVAQRVAGASTAAPVEAVAKPVDAGRAGKKVARGGAKKGAKKATPGGAKKAAQKAARKATQKAAAEGGKKAAKKAAKKATAGGGKKAAKKATGKQAAKQATAEAAKQAAKQGGKKAAKQAAPDGGGKQATAGSAGTAATGPLSDWLARLNGSIASLRADPRVDVVVNWQAPGATAAQLDAVEAKFGFKLGPAVRNLYSQADGLALVWGPKGECPKPVRGRPTMMYMEGLGGARGAIFMPPIAEVFGLRKRPFFDYAQFMPGDPPHWGFDFPGNFYTPAFVQVGDGLHVRVGDDHGAAWDGPSVSFERYLENVLATWGSIDERAKQFVTGKGKLVAAQPLAKLLK